jgi:hypothetical protein
MKDHSMKDHPMKDHPMVTSFLLSFSPQGRRKIPQAPARSG